MADCTTMHQRVWEYLDAELPATEVRSLGQHTGGCASCRAMSQFHRAFLDLLARQRSVVPPGRLVWTIRVTLRATAGH